MRADAGALSRNRPFTVFWAVKALSELGSAFSMVALPLLVLAATGSVAQMGLLTGITAVGSVLTGTVAGVLTDRWDTRRVLICCDLARLVLFGSVPVVWWALGPRIWLLYAVMAAGSVATMFFTVASSAAVPSLVPADQLTAAHGRIQATYGVGYVIGPVLAGLLAASVGPAAAVGVDAVSFGASAIGLCLIHIAPGRARAEPRAGGLTAPLLDGLRFIWRTPTLRSLTALAAPVSFLSLGLVDVFVYYVRHVLHESDHVVGLMLGSASVGAIVAALVAPAARRRLGFGACWLGAYLLGGAAIIVAVQSRAPVVVVAGATVFTFGETMAGVVAVALRQSVTPAALRGRVSSTYWMLNDACGPIGAAALTAVVGYAGVRLPLTVTGLLFVVVVLVGLGTPIRLRHHELTVRPVHPPADAVPPTGAEPGSPSTSTAPSGVPAAADLGPDRRPAEPTGRS